MNRLVVVGILLMILGGGLAIKGYYTEEETHGASILGAHITVTDSEKRPIPMWVSASLLGVGMTLTVIGALRSRQAQTK